jgi:hypothetical protein
MIGLNMEKRGHLQMALLRLKERTPTPILEGARL